MDLTHTYRKYLCNLQSYYINAIKTLFAKDAVVSGTLTVDKLIVNEIVILTNAISLGPVSATAGLSVDGNVTINVDPLEDESVVIYGNLDVNGVLGVSG